MGKYNEDVTNSEELEKVLKKNNIVPRTLDNGQKTVERKSGFIVYRDGEFTEHQGHHISAVLRYWGFLIVLIGLSVLVYLVLQGSPT